MNTSSILEYYQILGVDQQSTLEEIKIAYRKKAKQFHPDRNKNTAAHHDFILLNEAYEHLVNLKKNKNSREKLVDYDEWFRQQRAMSRHRAEAYAQMRYEEFLKSSKFQSASPWEIIFSHFYYFFALVTLIVLPVVGTIIYGLRGLGVSLFIMAITSPLTVDAVRNKPNINFRRLFRACLHVLKTGSFWAAVLTLINISLILRVGFQTLLPLKEIFTNFALSILAIFIITRWIIKPGTPARHYFYTFCLTPFLINLLFLINYVFSHNPTQETYPFHPVYQRSRGGMQKSTLINLENDAYSPFLGIRMFWSLDDMRNRNRITYTFKEGRLGVRVMTSYKFETTEFETIE